MTEKEIFQILGMEPTKDVNRIKSAYRNCLAVTNPEDDPEGFKRLRAAYESAMKLASEEEEKTVDDTPSGKFAQRAAEIYGNLSRRINEEEWKALFDEDVFVSLEDQEECRIKLLRFMMEHYRFPTPVWKLLGKKLDVNAKSLDKLKELFPADYLGFLVSRCEQGDELEYDRFEGAEDADYDQFLLNYETAWRAVNEERFEEAERCIETADALAIRHPAMEVCKGQLLVKTGQLQEAVAFYQELYRKYEQDLVVKFHYAELLWKLGEVGDKASQRLAAEIYEKIRENNERHYMANMRLSYWYFEEKRYKDAKNCAEKMLYSGVDDTYMEFLRRINQKLEEELERAFAKSQELLTGLELCWCYLQDGHPVKSMRIARQIADKVTPDKESEWTGLICKLYIELGDFEDSAEWALKWRHTLEKRLLLEEYADERERDEDRIRQSYLIRMQCFHHLGFVDPSYFNRSIEEGEAVLKGTLNDIQVMMELGQIYVEMGDYDKAESLAYDLIKTYQVTAANTILLESGRRQLNAGTVVRAAHQCIREFPEFVKAYEYVAKVYLDLEYGDDFDKLLHSAEENHVESVLLDAYRYLKDHPDTDCGNLKDKIDAFRQDYLKPVEDGDVSLFEKGLQIITEYLYGCPDSFMLVERAIFYKAARRFQEAKADYEKALSLSPTNPYALNGLSFVYRSLGDFDKALLFLKKALLYGKEEFSGIIYTDLAEVYCQLGEYQLALEAANHYASELEQDNLPIWLTNQLAEIYAYLGEVEKACELYRRQESKNAARSFGNCMDALAINGQYRKAQALLVQRANQLKIHTNIGPLDTIRPSCGIGTKDEAISFWIDYLWLALCRNQVEEGRKALKQLYALQKNRKVKYDKLYDCILASVAIRDKKLMKLFGNMLSFALQLNHNADKLSYFNSGKKYQMYRFFAALPEGNRSKLESILEEARKCSYCKNCTEQGCIELRRAEILFLLLFGEEEKAREMYESVKWANAGPLDWDLRALGRTFFGDFQE